MISGRSLSQYSSWVAVLSYFIGACSFVSGTHLLRFPTTRWIWTFACSALCLHVLLAFHFVHHWSHGAAYAETSRQTFEVARMNWGGGLFINYGLLVLWIADVTWLWVAPVTHQARPAALSNLWQGFLLFIFFNATAVFGHGVTRWIGGGLCLTLILIWWRSGTIRSNS